MTPAGVLALSALILEYPKCLARELTVDAYSRWAACVTIRAWSHR